MKKMQNEIPYKSCYNCGTELAGKYCHNCGQQATSKTPKIKDFILEYFNNAIIWDTQCLKTIAKLVWRPGALTNEYISGKFISQEHPLKLNMFLLFVFVSIFLLFSGPDKAHAPANILDKKEVIYPAVQVEFLKKKSEFAAKLNESPRDTVRLYAPLNLVQQHPDIIEKISVEEDTNGEGIDKWIAVIPRVFIDDQIVIPQEDGYYAFNKEEKIASEELIILKNVWNELVAIVTTYFPMMMLFTAPLLAMAVALIQRRKKQPFIHHLIFSLHYTALIELLIMVIYALHLITSPSMTLLQWILRLGSGIYLTIAFHRVYEPDSWLKALIKALLTYLIYMLNCLFLFIVVVLIACIVVAAV